MSNFFKHFLRSKVCRKKVVYVLPVSHVLPTCFAHLFIELNLLKNNKIENVHYAVFSGLILLPLSPKHSFSAPCSAHTLDLCSSHHVRHLTCEFHLHYFVCRWMTKHHILSRFLLIIHMIVSYLSQIYLYEFTIISTIKPTGWTVRGSNPGGGEIFHPCPDRLWDPPSLLYNWYQVFPGGKAAGAWPWPPTPI